MIPTSMCIQNSHEVCKLQALRMRPWDIPGNVSPIYEMLGEG